MAEMAGRLGHAVKRAEQVVMAEKARVLREFGLTVPQYVTLMTLHHVPGQSAAQLARAALVTPQTMATILGNLEEKGLVRRAVSTLHSKVLVTDLTDDGDSLLIKADLLVLGVEERLKGAFSDVEFRQLRSLLERAESALLADARDETAVNNGPNRPRPTQG
ncbi:MarR family transcriptional regulator [Agreia sp. PsM10]|uniref:MarR family winged helix-turn-helix transcriptional regulator n=1 Tax=Agreia sp. PsM10 TaxID=3030533 RepID=UPI00263A70A6|nr:MarR family transcriptional regulator [Agreia sp. PsM10]MDN4639422.1 MarR family transcriptional regulator [Agreia sp. PsM10]